MQGMRDPCPCSSNYRANDRDGEAGSRRKGCIDQMGQEPRDPAWPRSKSALTMEVDEFDRTPGIRGGRVRELQQSGVSHYIGGDGSVWQPRSAS